MYRKIHFDHITYQSVAFDLQLKHIVLFLSESQLVQNNVFLSGAALYQHPLPSSPHTALCQRTAAAPPRPRLSIPPRFPLSSPECLKRYQRVGVFIKEVNFKGFHLCRCFSPPPSASSSFNLAGVWQSKVNKCEMGHVFSIVSLCHTCSPLSMINIPPTPGPLSWRSAGPRAGRPAKTLPGHLELQSFQSPHFLSIWNPLSLSESPPPPKSVGWQDSGIYVYTGSLCLFSDRLFIGLH